MLTVIRRLLRKHKLKHIISSFGRIENGYSIDESLSLIHPENIYIGKAFAVGPQCRLQTWPVYNNQKMGYDPKLIIGDNVSFMSCCHVSCMNSVEIGNGVLLGDNVFITDNYHGSDNPHDLAVPPLQRHLYSKGPVKIGNNVWLGRNVCVMPSVTIGEGSVIGANSVVTHNIPPFSIYGGVPSHPLKSNTGCKESLEIQK